ERAVDALSPHRRMDRRADLAEAMRTAGLGVESRRGLPVEPADVVLLRGKQQRLAQRLAPGAQNLSRNPGMGRLADGENARGLGPKEHWREPWENCAAVSLILSHCGGSRSDKPVDPRIVRLEPRVGGETTGNSLAAG